MRYWLSCVMWNFGSWKTFGVFLESFWLDKNKTCVIANVPYSNVDFFYSTPDDLKHVFEVLEQYVDKTNHKIKNYFDNQKKVKDILLIVDEAHLYLDSRSSLRAWNNLERMSRLFTQCRKRKIRIVFITQRLTQIDVRVRRLADYVEEYHRGSFFGLYRVRKNVYENRWDIADIETDQTIRFSDDWKQQSFKEDAKIDSSLFTPLTFGLQIWTFFNSSWRRIVKEEYQTYFVCWNDDNRVNEISLDILLNALRVPEKPKLYVDRKQKYIPTFYKWYDKLFNKYEKLLDTTWEEESLPNLEYENRGPFVPENENLKRLFINNRIYPNE